MVGFYRKKVEVSANEMLQMFMNGMNHKEIAAACGCSIGAVYARIGKKSDLVKRAELTNQPVPEIKKISIPKNIAPLLATNPEPVDEPVPEPVNEPIPEPATPKKTRLAKLEENWTISLHGGVSDYLIDYINKTISLKNGLLEGYLDISSVDALIEELTEIKDLYERTAI